jgi:hypothetical protein
VQRLDITTTLATIITATTTVTTMSEDSRTSRSDRNNNGDGGDGGHGVGGPLPLSSHFSSRNTNRELSLPPPAGNSRKNKMEGIALTHYEHHYH